MATRSKTVTVISAGVIVLAGFALPLATRAEGDMSPRYTAEQIQNAAPSGTVELEATQAGLGIGGGTGHGTLEYGGKQYPFTVRSMSVGNVGVIKINATGAVYFLNNPEDFEGTYSAAALGATLGAG